MNTQHDALQSVKVADVISRLNSINRRLNSPMDLALLDAVDLLRQFRAVCSERNAEEAVAVVEEPTKWNSRSQKTTCAQPLNPRSRTAKATTMNGDAVDLGDVIRDKVREHGSYRKAAKAIGINYPYLCQMAHDPNRHPSKEILAALGLERVTITRSLDQPPAVGEGG